MPEHWTAERARGFFDYEGAEKEHANHCDLCGAYATDFVPIAERDRYGFHVRHVACAGCGHVFQYPRLAPEGLRALYAGPYRALVSAWHGREINAQTLAPEQSMYGARLALILGDAGVTGGRVLDLGGSTGVVAARVAYGLHGDAPPFPEGRHVTVVEPGAAEAAAAIRRADRVVVQSAEDFDADPGSFDLIMLCQTVDHLRSISAVLAKVRKWLAPGGRFFVDAVDWERVRNKGGRFYLEDGTTLVCEGPGPNWTALKIDHTYALTGATMRRYLETAGFVAREVEAPSENHVAFLCEVA